MDTLGQTLALWGVAGIMLVSFVLTFITARTAERETGTVAPAQPLDAPRGIDTRAARRRAWLVVVCSVGAMGLAAIATVTAAWLNERSAIEFGRVVTAGGVLQKLSYKGWVCKTWEGELTLPVAPGRTPVVLRFTVRTPTTLDALREDMGRDVAVTYVHRTRIWNSCLGDAPDVLESVDALGHPRASGA